MSAVNKKDSQIGAQGVKSAIDSYQTHIDGLIQQAEKLFDEWWTFAAANRKEVKAALYPKQNCIYELTREGKKRFNFDDDAEKPTTYVRVISTRWGNIESFRFFRSGDDKPLVDIYPRIKGVFLDSDFQEVYRSHDDISIRWLGNEASKDDAKSGSAKPTYVYVMIDKNTGLYKIGRSVNPNKRERTLQSEKPTIEMLFCYYAITHDEKVLHQMFEDKRYRGEWFSLNHLDLNKIKRYFEVKVEHLSLHEKNDLNRQLYEFEDKYGGLEQTA